MSRPGFTVRLTWDEVRDLARASGRLDGVAAALEDQRRTGDAEHVKRLAEVVSSIAKRALRDRRGPIPALEPRRGGTDDD